MKKLLAIWSLFKKGKEVANVEAWKNKQITATMLGVFLLACVQMASMFGFVIPMDEATATAIGAGIIGVGNVILTIITSKRAGMAPKQVGDSVQQDSAGEGGASSKEPVQVVSEANPAKAGHVQHAPDWFNNI